MIKDVVYFILHKDHVVTMQHSNIIGYQSNINFPPSKKKGNWISVVNEDSSTTPNDGDSLFEVQSDDHSNNDSIFEHDNTDEILP